MLSNLQMRHQHISFIKSGLRFAACIILFPAAPWAAGLLFAAEVIGVIEEIGHE